MSNLEYKLTQQPFSSLQQLRWLKYFWSSDSKNLRTITYGCVPDKISNIFTSYHVVFNL